MPLRDPSDVDDILEMEDAVMVSPQRSHTGTVRGVCVPLSEITLTGFWHTYRSWKMLDDGFTISRQCSTIAGYRQRNSNAVLGLA